MCGFTVTSIENNSDMGALKKVPPHQLNSPRSNVVPGAMHRPAFCVALKLPTSNGLW